MFDETTAKGRTNQQKKRKEGTLIYKDLVDAYEYFDGKCPYSETPIDEKDWHLEHIIPVSMGGTTDPWNCIPVCGPCNLSKSGDHLLDWWDKNNGPEYEYRLEKLFLYLIEVLNKDRRIRISTKEEEKKLKELEHEEQIDESNLPVTDKKLDTFTFMYQLLNHLSSSKQIKLEKLNKYNELLQFAYNKNKEFPRLDIELYLLQNKFTKYLKQIEVIKHYEISFEYVDRISDLNLIKENVNNISNYLSTENIGDLINKNHEILFMNIEKFKYNFEYLINDIGIDRNIVLQNLFY